MKLRELFAAEPVCQPGGKSLLQSPPPGDERRGLVGADQARLAPVAGHVLARQQAQVYQPVYMDRDDPRLYAPALADVLGGILRGLVGQKQQNIYSQRW